MPLSLYIHIPFCKSKCFYCSFASFENKHHLIAPYLDALKKEASNYKGAKVDTVYIGGGTPTILNVDHLKALFSTIGLYFAPAHDAEVTIEANPATFDLEKANMIRQLGVNRASLGIQSFNDKYLTFLGRPHTRADAFAAFETLRSAGLHNINLDLIYSLPAQTEDEIKMDLDELVSLGSEHISLYALTISEGSEFYRRRVEPALEEEQARHYRFACGRLKTKGYIHYEVSNFSKDGYACRHNLNYWLGGNYIGLGVGAHSHKDGHRSWNTPDLETYIKRIEKKGSARSGEERLSQDERFMETFLIGLRLMEGVDVKKLESAFEVRLAKEKADAINDMVRHGLLVKKQGRIKATPAGIVVLDEICARLI